MKSNILLKPTLGRPRGSVGVDSGEPLMNLDGKQLLGRALNVFGETIDRGKKINMEAQAGH